MGGLRQECDGVAGHEGSRTNQANAEFDNLAGQARVWYPSTRLLKPLGEFKPAAFGTMFTV